ncbi:MAG: PTS sugar transporter subunit IIA [Acidisphaera sp.]|nr:PTS sugar transporter subunit IIA [Acidisphaera sp.]
MQLRDLIGPDQVIVGLRAGDKVQLLGELARRAAARVEVPAPAILHALSTRERLGSTGFGRGFALPHARVDGLGRRFGLLARLARPIDFEAIDGQPVDMVFLLLIPPHGESDHVAALAAVAREMRDQPTLQKIRAAKTAAALYQTVVEGAP